MKKIIILLLAITSLTVFGQVGIGTQNPNTSAILDVESTTKGFLPTRVTTAQRDAIASPATGLIVYNTTIPCLQVNDGTPAAPVWTCVGLPAAAPGAIATIDCAGATANGTLTSGTAASGVNSVISYTGGNGGTHAGQTVTSTGVTGLTATLAAGSFATGAGTLNYNITGTPASSGTATFAINIGGQTCNLTRTVVSGSNITTLNCAGATITGNLTQGVLTPAGVTSVISYTGGDGSAHSGQTVTSTGVTGLTATLVAGSFASGAGTLTYTFTGTPAGFGNASFAINIGGQTCNLTRWVNASVGAGSFSGKTCFDIALGNDNTNSCGPLSARTATQANFTQAATHTQSYTFTPSGTVSNVRFFYVNTNGSPVTAISGNNTGNNISTAVVATVNYVTTNTPFAGLTNANPHTADLYVIYNDGTTNNGTDRQLKLTANIKDCACCVAKISPTVTKDFLCHNLGANTSLDPHDMAQTNAWGLNGAYIQWGRRGPNTTGDSRVDWVTAANTSNFAAAPTGSTAGTANSGSIAGWGTTAAANNSWRTAGGAKTANDPCPAGYRVPTSAEWTGVNSNNTVSRSGAWTSSATYYSSALHYGPNASTKLLTLPAAGSRTTSNGLLANRGDNGTYWSSTESSAVAHHLYFTSSAVSPAFSSNRTFGFSLRCIEE